MYIYIYKITNPAPYIDPILYDNPSDDPDATSAVITSPEPFARANNVTAAKASGNSNHSEIYAIEGAKYSSTT